MNKSLLSIYRACGRECNGDLSLNRPIIFNKFKSWKSFFDSFFNYSDIVVIWDGPENALSEYIKKFPVKFEIINFCNNQKSLAACYNYIEKEIDNYSYYNLQEDDFEFTKESGRFMLDALNYGYSPFTLYNHPDRYLGGVGRMDITLGNDFIGITSMGYVRTCESTVCSFAASKEFFIKELDHLIYYCFKGVGAPDDCGYWRHLYNRKAERLWSHIPGLSAHMVTPLPYHTDWNKINENIQL